MNGPTFESSLPTALTKAENLPSLPAVAVEMLRLCEDEQSTVKDLARAVQRDPALAVKMLKLANSSLFSLGHPVATLDHASMVLGMKTVKLMSLSFSLAHRLPKKGTSCFDYTGYWRRSLIAAVAGRALAKRAGAGTADEAFLGGLLSHIGQLVLAESLPELYLDVVSAEAPRWPTIEVEQSRLGFHSADVAGALIATWKLPELIGVPVAYCARPDEIPAEVAPEARSLARLLSVALRIVSVVCDEDNGAALLALEEDAERHLDMAPEEIEPFLTSLERGIREAAEMLAIEVPDTESHAEILARARERIVAISLDATADLRSAELHASSLQQENRVLAERATTDKLTGLHNRAAFDEFLDEQILRRREGGVPRALGLIMLDVDHFKNFNDTFGHQAGDLVLARIGEVLRRTTRKSDHAARYGGEEFVLVFPEITPTYLRMVASRIRAAIESEQIEYEGQSLRVTASLGAVCVSRTTGKHDAEMLVRVADKLLYHAKESGRNRVETFSRSSLMPQSEESE